MPDIQVDASREPPSRTEFFRSAPGPGPKEHVAGTHRTVAPTVTLQRLLPMRSVFGITRVANVTGLDVVGIPVVVVCRPNSRSLSVSQGKGLDLAAASVSGLMESIEGWHAERIVRPLRLASHAEMSALVETADPRRLPQISVSRYHEHLRLPWVEGYDVASGRGAWVPYEMVHLDMTIPLPEGSGCFPLGSNGLASGNHLLESSVHAICEVIERDAYALWQYRAPEDRLTRRIDLETLDDPASCSVVDRLRDAGLLVALWDITSDIDVPTFRCTVLPIRDDPHRPLYPSSGLGCHPTRHVAAFRALSEAVQSRLTRISSSRDDDDRADYELTRNPDRLGEMRTRLIDEVPIRRFGDIETFESDDVAGDLDWVVGRLVERGFNEVVLVDLTRPEFAIPVVRAIVPGLEPKPGGPGYAPGPRVHALQVSLP